MNFEIAARDLIGALTLGTVLMLVGCASLTDAPRLAYACPEQRDFDARLYGDIAIIEGVRGHAVLKRVPPENDPDGALRYADATVRASFGLGVDGRLVRLDYTGIPEPIYCQRKPSPDGGGQPEVKATTWREGPRPPPPFDPNAPVETNIRFGDAPLDPG